MDLKQELIDRLGVPKNWDKYDYQTQRYSFDDMHEVLDAIVKKLTIHGVGNSYGVNKNDINDYGEYMLTDVGLGNFPEIDFKEWFKSEELQKRRKNYH